MSVTRITLRIAYSESGIAANRCLPLVADVSPTKDIEASLFESAEGAYNPVHFLTVRLSRSTRNEFAPIF